MESLEDLVCCIGACTRIRPLGSGTTPHILLFFLVCMSCMSAGLLRSDRRTRESIPLVPRRSDLPGVGPSHPFEATPAVLVQEGRQAAIQKGDQVISQVGATSHPLEVVASVVVVRPVDPPTWKGPFHPPDEYFVAYVHPKCHMGLPTVPPEVTSSDEQPDHQTLLEFVGHSALGLRLYDCFTVRYHVEPLRGGTVGLPLASSRSCFTGKYHVEHQSSKPTNTRHSTLVGTQSSSLTSLARPT